MSGAIGSATATVAQIMQLVKRDEKPDRVLFDMLEPSIDTKRSRHKCIRQFPGLVIISNRDAIAAI